MKYKRIKLLASLVSLFIFILCCIATTKEIEEDNESLDICKLIDNNWSYGTWQ